MAAKDKKKATNKKVCETRKNSGPTKAGKKSGTGWKKPGVKVTRLDIRGPWVEPATREDMERLKKYSAQELEKKQMWASLDEADKTVYRKMFSD